MDVAAATAPCDLLVRAFYADVQGMLVDDVTRAGIRPKLHAAQIHDIATLRSLDLLYLVLLGLSNAEVNAIQAQLQGRSSLHATSTATVTKKDGSTSGTAGVALTSTAVVSDGLRAKARVADTPVGPAALQRVTRGPHGQWIPLGPLDMVNDPDSVYHTMVLHPDDDDDDNDDDEFGGFGSDVDVEL